MNIVFRVLVMAALLPATAPWPNTRLSPGGGRVQGLFARAGRPVLEQRQAAGVGSNDLSSALRLLASQSLLATAVDLRPDNPDVLQTLDGPVIFDVLVGSDPQRTHFLLHVSHSFSWHQVPNGVPLQVSVGLRLFINSDVLPPPGSFEALGIFAEGEVVSNMGSNADILRQVGFARALPFDVDFLAINLHFAYPDLSDDELHDLATGLVQSSLELKVQPNATVRSVDLVSFGRIRSLQVWGG